jgi:SAM-dependent methyltransferase
MHGNESEPSDFLVENIGLLPKGAKVLDVGMGNGRNALYLAKAGYDVEGIDVSQEAVASAMLLAKRVGVVITAQVADLEQDYRLKMNAYDLIICFNYLHRPLIPQIKAAINDNGLIVYETFIVDQAQFGRPSNPDHLLKHNELLEVFGDFRCLRYHEGIYPGPKAVAGIIAQKV